MTRPIIIDDPKILLQEIDTAGAPVGSPVDVSCDVASAEIGIEQDIETVSTFCGKYRIAGKPEFSLTLGIVAGPDTTANWTPLIGDQVEVRIYDSGDATRYRMVKSEIPLDPSVIGPTDAEEQVRAYDLELPVYSDPVWVTAA